MTLVPSASHPRAAVKAVVRDLFGPPAAEAARGIWAAHAGWLAVMAMVAGVVTAVGAGAGLGLTAALLLPGLAGGVLARHGVGAQIALALIWVAASILMMAYTGGVGGPATILLIIPVALAWISRRRDAAFEALVLVLCAVLGLMLAQLAGALPPVQAIWQHPLLGGVLTAGSLTMAVAGFAAGRPMPVVITEVDRRADPDLVGLDGVLHCNAAAMITRFEGSLPSVLMREVLHTPLSDMAYGDDQPLVQQAWHEAWHKGAARVVFRAAVAAGTVWLELSLLRQNDGVAGQLVDVTRWKMAEAALIAAREDALAASRAKTRFLANMSHELRTPLNAIIGFSDVMRQCMFGPLSAKYTEYAGLIHDSGQHLLDLIGDVLDMAKIEAEKYTLTPETFNIADAVSDCLKLTRRTIDDAGQVLSVHMPEPQMMVLADRRAVKQIVLNLLSNAIKFTPQGGQISVALTSVGPDILLDVSDTGAGIAPEDLKRLGRPFEQVGDAGSRAKGTGLGLSLVRALAGLHNGGIELDSTIGVGTSVRVRLPVRVADVPVDEAEPDRGPAQDLMAQLRTFTTDLTNGTRE